MAQKTFLQQSHFPRRHTYRLDNGRQSPLCAEKSVAVQLSRRIYVSVQHVNSNHAWVHGVWVFLHGSSGNGFPWVAGNRNPNQTLKNMHVNEASFVTCRIILYKCNFRENYFPKHWPKDKSGGFVITLNSSRLRPVSCAQAVWCPQSLAAASSAIFPTYPCPLSSHCF